MKKGTVPILLAALLASPALLAHETPEEKKPQPAPTAPAKAEPTEIRETPARSPRPAREITKATLWALLPGGGHFYLGDPLTGTTYAALTGGLLLAGAEVSRRNEELDRDDELNVPSIVAEKVWEYSIFTTFREAAKQNGVDLRAERFDDTPTSTLLLAPFDPDQWLRPTVFGAALLGLAGAGLNAALDDEPTNQWQDIDRAYMLGSDYDRENATWLYGASTLGISLGAGVAEEALFRGILQTILQDQWGNSAGLWAASGVFGAAHLVGGDGGLNLGGALWATGAGAYLGWLYNHDDNRLAAPIAAHFWYDFMLIAGMWAFDPDDNPLGFDVKFQF